MKQGRLLGLLLGICLLAAAVIFVPHYSNSAEAGTEETEDNTELIEQTIPVPLFLKQRLADKKTRQRETKQRETKQGEPDQSVSEEERQPVNTESLWTAVYHELIYQNGISEETLICMALAEAEDRELKLLSETGDHLVTYAGQRFIISDEDYQVLLRIVAAEAPSEDVVGMMLVANVVMNRVISGDFPDTIPAVVFQKNQFAPTADGYYWRAEVTDQVIEAVERVLAGEDESQGALYFMERARARAASIRWFDRDLQFLFQHGCHEFFKEKQE